jgi:site-specific recombinase XerD
MRDLYSRKKRLDYWTDKIHRDLDGTDKIDMLKFLEIMEEKDQAILTIVKGISVMNQLRKQFNKPFCQVTKEDMKLLFKWMNYKGYSVETHEKFRAVLKKFFKMVYGNNESYPECVKWFTVKVGKDKKSQERQLDINEYLEEEEIKKLIEAAPTIQKKAFLACLYETGARPEEYLRLTNLDIKIDTNGAIFILRGKTGERRIRIVSFAPLLQQWLDITPLKHEKQFPIWISEATNRKNEPLGLRAAENIVSEALNNAGLRDKHARLYLLRHSRATYLANHLTESQLCVFFGWIHGTKVLRRYIHMSGRNLDNTLLSIAEGKPVIKEDESRLKIFKCNRCSETLSPTMQFCGRCGLSTKLAQQYTKEMELEEEKERKDQELLILKKQLDKIQKQVSTLILSLATLKDQDQLNQTAKILYDAKILNVK